MLKLAWRLFVATLFACAVHARAASTVTGSVFNASATASTNSKVSFLPLSTPVVDNGTTYISKAVTLFATNGNFSTPLVVGKYTMRIDDSTRDQFTLYVPNDSTTYAFTSLITNAANFATTNAFAFVTRTNGTAVNLTVNSTSTPSPSAGQVLTRLPDGTAGWSNSAGGSSSGSAFAIWTNNSIVATNPSAVRFTNSGNVTFTGQSNSAGAVLSANVDLSSTTNSLLQFATNSATLSVNMRRLGFAYQQLDGGPGPFRVGVIADTAPYFGEIMDTFGKVIGYNGFDIPYNQWGYLTNGSFTNRAVAEGLTVTTNWPGAMLDGGPGSYIIFTNAYSWAAALGGSTYGDRLNFRAIGDVGSANAVKIYSKTNGGAWTLGLTVDTSGSHRPIWTNVNVLPGYYQLMFSNSGSGVLRLPGAGGGGIWATNGTGVRGSAMISGNLDFPDVFLRATNISVPMIRDMGLHLNFYSEISGPSNYVNYGVQQSNWMAAAVPVGSFVQVTPWPGSPGTSDQGFAMRSNGVLYGFSVFDGSQGHGTYYNLTNQGGIGDGVHATEPAGRTIGISLWNECGFGGALAVALAKGSRTGAVPFRDEANTWTGLNTFETYVTTRGSLGAFVAEDRNGASGANVKLSMTAPIATIEYYQAAFLEMEGVDGSPSFKPALAYSNQISLGDSGRPFNGVWLTGGEAGTNIAARAPYAATTAGSNAVPTLNGSATNLTVSNMVVSGYIFTNTAITNLTINRTGSATNLGLTVAGNGSVGIGTTTPTNTLQVAGMASADAFAFTTKSNTTLYYGSTGEIRARIGGTDAVAIDNVAMNLKTTGAIGWGSTSDPYSGSVAWLYKHGNGTNGFGRTTSTPAGSVIASNAVFVGGLQIGPGVTGSGGFLTNILYASATLDFASQTVGSFEDLPITVAGAADGDIVTVTPATAMHTGIVGSYSGYPSNGVVYVRFVSTGTAQNPPSGTVKVKVEKFQ